MDLSARLKLWKDAFLSPTPTFTAQAARKDVAWTDGLFNYGVSYAFYMFVAFVFDCALSLLGGSLGTLGVATLAIAYVIVFVVALIFQFLFAGIYHLIAKALGGKGRFKTLYYTLSLAAAPIYILAIFGFIPCLGIVILLALGIYSLYLMTIAIQKTHKLSLGRSIAVWGIPLAIILIILVIIAIVAFAFLMAAFASIVHTIPNTASLMLG